MERHMTIEEIREMPGTYFKFQTGEWAIFWDDTEDDYTIAKYSHSEVTTPIHRHWTQTKKYFHNVAQCVNFAHFLEACLIEDGRKTKI